MKPLTMAVLAIAGIAISVPAGASPTVSGETHARPAQAVVQYAQTDIIGLGYKSKKSKTSKTSKKPKTDTTGQAKSGEKSGTTGQ
jgi:hypothetical protein